MGSDSSEKPVEKPSERKEKASHDVRSGMFRLTEWCSDRVNAKRKRRGLGELKPRKKNAMRQIFANGICLSMASALVAPLERARIVLQTAPMSNYRQEMPSTARGLLQHIS